MKSTKQQENTFIPVLKALLKYYEEHGEKNVPITKLKALIGHYNL